MTDFDFIKNELQQKMVQGEMHLCLRDIGALAGGFLAAGRIDANDCAKLCEYAKSLAINKPEAERKWNEAVAYGTRKPVFAQEYRRVDTNQPLDWSTVINDDDYKIVDQNWLETEIIEAPNDDWNPCQQLADYISLLFQPDDYIGYCVSPFERDGKWLPDRGTYTQKASELLKGLHKGKFEQTIGTLNNEKSGAWIRINPLDGNGVSDANITEYRYALVESDGMEIEKQVAIYKKLELPCACIVHSGGKSAHAIVKIFAQNLEEYRKRVDFLYEVCANNGLIIDKQNRNPSRYSRMPGVLRDGKKQYLIERTCGKASFDEWETWIKDLNDNLPDFESLSSLDINNPPPLKPVVIDGVLREGFKMRLQGPSKAGKSFALIELAIAMAEGTEWLGHKCRQGRVLYINLELDKNSALNRFAAIYKKLNIPPSHIDMIDCWHLRGKTMALDKLTPKLIRRAKDRGYSMIILDPIYKVLTGDENSASEMAVFCNYFDQIATECGCCFVDCHHHSKGAQGAKKSMDRSSGSGVFARDPDAIIDFLPLETEAAAKVLLDDTLTNYLIAKCDELWWTEVAADGWRSEISIDKQNVPEQFMQAIIGAFEKEDSKTILDGYSAIKESFSATGWNVSYTVRDFRTPKDHRVWFMYPIHTSERDDLLIDCRPEGEEAPPWKRKREKQIVEGDNRKIKPKRMFMNDCVLDPTRFKTLDDIVGCYKVDRSNASRWVKEAGGRVDHKTGLIHDLGKIMVNDK